MKEIWKEEKEIQKIKTERNISYTEAKKFMKVFSSERSATYAQVSALKKNGMQISGSS